MSIKQVLQFRKPATLRRQLLLSLISLLFLPVLGYAQSSNVVSQQNILDELKAMRTSLERLEKSQKALIALISVQLDETRVVALEAQRQRLAAQAQDMEKQSRQLTEDLRNVDSGGLAIAVQTAGVPDAGFRAAMVDRQRDSEQKLDEVRRSMQAVDQEIGALRSRIRDMEKLVMDAMK